MEPNWHSVFSDRLYTDEALEEREVEPRDFRRWLRGYVADCQASNIVQGFKRGLPVLDMAYAVAPWFKTRCSLLGLDPFTGKIVGDEGRTSRPRTHSALVEGALDMRSR